MTKKVCEYCGEKIDEKKQTYVSLSTITPKDKQESFFHFECFKKNHEEQVKKKAQNIINDMQQKAMSLFQTVGGGLLFGNVLGQNKFEILGGDLNKENGKSKRKKKV